jgi:hypothetical protein
LLLGWTPKMVLQLQYTGLLHWKKQEVSAPRRREIWEARNLYWKY